MLVKKNLFPRFDYLSTVSGGGYLGSFLSCALGTEIREYDKEGVERIEDAFNRESEKTESGLIRHIRNNSKYLLNGGAMAKLKIAGILIGGLL